MGSGRGMREIVTFEAPQSGISDGQKFEINLIFPVGNYENDQKFKGTGVSEWVSEWVSPTYSLARVLAFQSYEYIFDWPPSFVTYEGRVFVDFFEPWLSFY